MNIIRVSANSQTAAVAGVIVDSIREHKRTEIQAIGTGAVNQAVTALELATGSLMKDSIFVTCVPEFSNSSIEDREGATVKIVVDTYSPY